MSRKLLLSLLAAWVVLAYFEAALRAQELIGGVTIHHNSPADDWGRSLDLQFKSGHLLGAVVQFDSRESWLAGTRAILFRPHKNIDLFLQDAIRRADQAPSKRFGNEPWIVQTGAGLDGRWDRFRLQATVSESNRLNTSRPGYLFNIGTYYRLWTNVDFRVLYIQAHTPTGRSIPIAEGSQIGGGFAYTLKLRKD